MSIRQHTFTLVAGAQTIQKGDDEHLDYGIDYADLLQPGETITGATWTVASGLVAGQEYVVDTVAVKWLSGGTPGETYDVDSVVTTSQGRVYERSFRVQIVARRWG